MFTSKFETQIYAVLRILTGFLFLCHGSQILFNYPPSEMEMPQYIFWIAGPIEFFGGLLVMIGLFTPWAASLTGRPTERWLSSQLSTTGNWQYSIASSFCSFRQKAPESSASITG
jgi:hypothetical protein